MLGREQLLSSLSLLLTSPSALSKAGVGVLSLGILSNEPLLGQFIHGLTFFIPREMYVVETSRCRTFLFASTFFSFNERNKNISTPI